ncbi:TetR/AcrR family transcriptional regulator [Streptomyces aurantiacus]|uniref:TetR/AcrR family transcriptional regulator n=1 Tax=Streptomyces aurantiacus TaxID=47760 RepID=UPI00099E46BC|nr:TetR family transcriptional regulator [Streptomyces aurantiacus]
MRSSKPKSSGAGPDRALTTRAAGVVTSAAVTEDADADAAADVTAGGTGTAAATDSGPGRRDAEATRAAILRAARHLLARHAHGDITLKAVAERAGVSPPLIVKYFGNKEALFARVMSFEEDAAALLDAPLADLGHHMVRHVLVSQSERGSDPLARIVFAPLHGSQGDTLRTNFRTQVSDRLALRLEGPDAGLRAELAVSMLLGLGVMYGIARGEELRARALDVVVERYAPAVQACLTP